MAHADSSLLRWLRSIQILNSRVTTSSLFLRLQIGICLAITCDMTRCHDMRRIIRDEHGFNEYFSSMPWTAMPFSEREKKAQLSSRYGVQGIPTLVVLNIDGSVITKDARECIMDDPTGVSFPWTPMPVPELIGSSFITAGGAVVDKSGIEGKV